VVIIPESSVQRGLCCVLELEHSVISGFIVFHPMLDGMIIPMKIRRYYAVLRFVNCGGDFDE
jgi:hypothetical protein